MGSMCSFDRSMLTFSSLLCSMTISVPPGITQRAGVLLPFSDAYNLDDPCTPTTSAFATVKPTSEPQRSVAFWVMKNG
ncbi:MAG: hypothetical protein DWC07_05005 [Candidatus Poseidoniales archaeon]|nr:MAG: hypothetical protein DWC07_05005 [Candidatus Poseidoniales archaeon]